MEIDWITVVAQIINFLILVLLLKRFLYQPVITAMERRERGIAERIRDAEERDSNARNRERAYQERLDSIDEEREQLLGKARETADGQRQALLDEARAAIEAQREQWRKELLREQEGFLRDLKRDTATMIARIARHALDDLADAELERQIIRSFIHRLDSLDIATREALAGSKGPWRVVSSFDIDDETGSALVEALQRAFGRERAVAFGRDTELICGIALIADGRKVGWNVAEYTRLLEQSVHSSLEAATTTPMEGR